MNRMREVYVKGDRSRGGDRSLNRDLSPPLDLSPLEVFPDHRWYNLCGNFRPGSPG